MQQVIISELMGKKSFSAHHQPFFISATFSHSLHQCAVGSTDPHHSQNDLAAEALSLCVCMLFCV